MTQNKYDDIKNKLVWKSTYNYVILAGGIFFSAIFYPGPNIGFNKYQLFSGFGILFIIFMIHMYTEFKFHGRGVMPSKPGDRPTTYHKDDCTKRCIPHSDYKLLITGGFDYMSFSPPGNELYILYKDDKYVDELPTGIVLRGKLWLWNRKKLLKNPTVMAFLEAQKGFSEKTIKQGRVLSLHSEYVEPPKLNDVDMKVKHPLHSSQLKDLRNKYLGKVREEETRKRRFSTVTIQPEVVKDENP